MNPSSQGRKKEIALITVEILEGPCMQMLMQMTSPYSSFILSMWHCFNILMSFGDSTAARQQEGGVFDSRAWVLSVRMFFLCLRASSPGSLASSRSLKTCL